MPGQGCRQQFPGKKKTDLAAARKKRFEALNRSQEMHQTTGEYELKAFANSLQEVVPPGGNQMSMTHKFMQQNSVIVQNANRSKYT